jgi:pyridoxine/pyridoxamine 5'-phosphate oxidase
MASRKKITTWDPIAQFSRWFRDEVSAGTELPEAMALATASHDAIPSVRFVRSNRLTSRAFASIPMFAASRADNW